MTRARKCGKRPLRTAALAAMLFAVASCQVGPAYRRPDLPSPAQYVEAAPDSRPRRAVAWWEDLADPALQALITQAAARSFDLRIMVARVEEACALRGVARARQYPPIDVGALIQKQQDSGNSLFFTEPITSTQYRLELQSSWEIDLWGRVRREVEAASADLQAAEDMLADTLRIVIAQVASEYIELRGAEQELVVLNRNVEVQRGTADLTERLVADGLGNHADVARAKGLMLETESAAPILESRVKAAIHRLAVLTASDAEWVRQALSAGSGLPTAPATPALGVPSELLQARPDVRAAERELAAATARIGVAVADLFPQVSLNGRFGLDSTEAGTVFEPDSISYGIGPALRWPLLDWGTVRCQIRAQGARQRAALARYEHVAALALTEVESSLAALQARQKSRVIFADAVTQNREAARLVEARFREGATSFLDVLEAQRRMLLVEALLVRLDALLLLDFVTLSRALG